MYLHESRVSGQIREFYKVVYWCFKGKKDIISQVKGELHMDLGVVVKLMSNLLIKIIKFRKEGWSCDMSKWSMVLILFGSVGFIFKIFKIE
uniref:Uncharacterized protein n=1 Tax=Lactuca sativa TaxID=4236 RepID=A0A9R1XAF0_LACSA|nr:hypothetical protein LSAT_V11C500246890 [Lactuca sativa]